MEFKAFFDPGYFGSGVLTKTLRVMKLTAVLLLAACLQVSAKSNAQSVTLSEKNASLEKVFKEIKNQSGYTFVYRDEWLKKASKVNIDLRNVTVEEALEACFKDQPLTYSLIKTTVVVRLKLTPELQSGDSKKNVEAEVTPPPTNVHGVVKDENGKPAAGVSVRVKGTTRGTSTNDNGEFSLTGVADDAILVFSAVNLQGFELKINGKNEFAVTLKTKVNELADVSVQVNTGYQSIPKERATGSFVQINNELLNRSVSTDIISRLDGVTSGLIFNKNIVSGNTAQQANQSVLTIRGRSTINANPNALIVVDNFPYDGDIKNINPNDVESITVLKDAAAASIWGARSSNGVIVITTKKGGYNQPMKLSFNTNLTIGSKPDLYYQPVMSASDYIDVEEFLFSKNYYNATSKSAFSPVVELLFKNKNGTLDSTTAYTQINALRNQDVRTDLNKYFYQKSVNQQYAINLSGGGINNQYYFSAGFDRSIPNSVNNSYNRVTLDAKNTYSFIKNHLELFTEVAFAQSKTIQNGSYSVGKIYERLADANGSALPIQIFNRQAYIDTVGQGKLLDWNYRPLDEIRNADNSTKLIDYRINVGLKYKISKGFDATILYQYGSSQSTQNILNNQSTYFTRNLINQFSQLNYATGTVAYKVPLGGILDQSTSSSNTSNIRGQLNYSHSWNGVHELTAIAGAELKDYTTQARSYRLYGYNNDLQINTPVDYVTLYPTLPSGSSVIPNNISNLGITNRYVSFFANAAYSYKQRYTFSLSMREDESNLFGVNTNQKGVQLGSAGIAWNISGEDFYKFKGVPYLKLRITDGYNGNLDNSASALPTAVYNFSSNSYGAPYAINQTPPNPSLRWEKVNVMNFGVDFGLRNNIVTGSIEYYVKNGKDLLANSPIAPQSGFASFYGNTADMKGQGIDVMINTKNIDKQIKWYSSFLFNYSLDQITGYNVKTGIISSYLTPGVLNPLIGKPLYSVFSYMWAGLDSAGNPQGYLDGKVSNNYSGFNSSGNLANLQYNGPANPPFFGSLRNTIAWKQLSFSFLITYKFGYYFRRPSIVYNTLFNGGAGNPDYEQRWQKPGDEKSTNVPSMIYPDNGLRDAFYQNSNILVEKGDHIRLQDIQLSYDFNKHQLGKFPVKALRLYVYANNIGILWKANKYGIDPDFVPSSGGVGSNFPNPRTFAAGAKVDF